MTATRVVPTFGRGTRWRQFLRQVRLDTVGVFRSVPFLVLLVLGLANFIPGALFQQSMYETAIYPVTSQMVAALQSSYGFMLVVAFLACMVAWGFIHSRILGWL